MKYISYRYITFNDKNSYSTSKLKRLGNSIKHFPVTVFHSNVILSKCHSGQMLFLGPYLFLAVVVLFLVAVVVFFFLVLHLVAVLVLVIVGFFFLCVLHL